jgi:DTW domain-containing protein
MHHAVARLRSACLAHSNTRPYLDRGDALLKKKKPRCDACRLPPAHCLCALRPPPSNTRAGVCLIMAEFEPLKPSNTGWLIADLLADTFAFGWSRVAVDPALPALLADPHWQPLLVFPAEFAAPERVLAELPYEVALGDTPAGPRRRPLFVLLDGTWSEARKIFRKSPYLAELPVLSLLPEQLSRYRLRRSYHEHHFCTSEVAALCLAMAGEASAAQRLEAYLDLFSSRYLSARQSQPPDEGDAAHQRWRELMRDNKGQ